MKRHKRWTREEDDAVDEMLEDGSTMREMAQYLGLKREQVSRRLRTRGIRCGQKPRYNLHARSLVMRMLTNDGGASTTEIAKARGVCLTSAREMMNRLVREGLVVVVGYRERGERVYKPSKKWGGPYESHDKRSLPSFA